MKTKSIILSLMILSLSFIGCGKKEVEQVDILRNVTYKEVNISEATTEKLFSGTVRGATEANLSFRVPGNLMVKYAGLGTRVNKGEVLATLDPKDYQINYAEALATLAEARANVTRTAADYRRYRELFLNDNASKAEFDNSKAAYEAANARLGAVQERLSFAKLQLSYTRLVAPFAGTVTVEMADESENLNAGSPIFTLVREETPEVQIFLPEDYTNKIRIGDEVNIIVDALTANTYSGTIKEIGSGVTGLGNTLPAKVTINEATTDIKTGMTAQVTLGISNPNAGRLIVPLSSVSEDGNGSKFVYILTSSADGTATLAKKNIELGVLIGRDIEVLSGINSGDKVVTAGVNFVSDGQKVKISAKN